MCDPAQEQTQNSELAFLTEHLQYLQNRIAILESYNEMASPYVSSAELTILRDQVSKSRYEYSIPMEVQVHHTEFREAYRFQIPTPPRKTTTMTVVLSCSGILPIPLYLFALEVSGHATLHTGTRTQPHYVFYPFVNMNYPPQFIDEKLPIVGTFRSTLTIQEPSNYLEFSLYVKNGYGTHWSYIRPGAKQPNHRIRDLHLDITIE